MKLFVGWAISAGLLVAAAAAGAQSLPPGEANGSPYARVSDFGGPYAAMPPEPLPRSYGAPSLLPPQEVYTVLRENGFSPLGVPQQRGFVYSIAVIDRTGESGRLAIDARNGQIIRFLPEVAVSYGLARPAPLFTETRRVPRPPAPIPHVASRSPTAVPLPKEMPKAVAEPKVETPQVAAPPPAAPPIQQSASVQQKPADAAPPTAAPQPDVAKPSVKILPTQVMPKAQGLD